MTIVRGHGNPNAKIIAVGEAPASTEQKTGIPFSGRAGEEFNKLLSAAGINRDDIYVTNISLEPVQGDKKAFFWQGGQPSAAYVNGLVELIKDIQRIKPNVVVAFGNYAMAPLVGFDGIMKRRGSLYWSELAQVKVVPTIHPAALLRGKPDEGEKAQGGMYKMRNPVIWDLQRARREAAFPELRRRPRTLLVDPAGRDYEEAIGRLRVAKHLVVDIESWGGTRLACIGFSDGDPEWAVTLSGTYPERMEIYRKLLESDVPKVGQNLMYDATMLDQNGIFMRNVWWDTMISSHILYPDLPKSLAFLNSIYTDIPYYKDEGKVWDHGDRASPEQIKQYYEYNAKDICATAEVWQAHREELEERGLNRVFRGTMDVFEPLRKATYRGFKCDVSKLWQLIDETQKKADSAHQELVNLAGREINVNSHVQVKKLLYEERKLGGGKVQSSEQGVILDLAARSGDPAPYLIVKERRQKKLLSTYYHAGILSPDGRIRFGFNIPGTFGARISSSAPLWGPGLNGQNIPIRHKAKAREMFIPDDGYTLLEFDQAQAEAVVVAYLANDPIHMDCFRYGKDVHRVTACLLTDQPTSEWKNIPKPSALRELAKTCNHELNYNAGPFQFMMTVNQEYDPEDPESVKLDKPLAQEIHRKYIQTRPALPAWWESIRNELKLNRTLRTPFGREYQFLDQWSQDLLNKAYSYKPQATVGEITNYGIAQVLGIRPSELVTDWDAKSQELRRMGLEFLLQVHDSTIWQVPDEAVDEAVKLIPGLLEVPFSVNGYNLIIPIEGAKGKTWYKEDMDSLGVSRKSAEVGYE